jgi:DHA1 family bicyclomycin/chloramphenicol resistance-like MFS transporter
MSAFPPLSTDIYLPALPQLKEILNTSEGLVNLTLALFFIFFAGGALLWGPLSEKFGRKPILLFGLALYTMASIGCAFSHEIGQLIVCRMFQGLGGSAPAVISTAIVKDLFEGRARHQMLTMIYSIVVVAPIIGPVLGAILMQYISWRAIFQLLANIGLFTFMCCAFIGETLEKRYQGSVCQSLGRLVLVLFRPKFALPLFVFSMIPMSILSFIASAAYIYINDFGLNELQCGYLLAFNSLFTLAGPIIFSDMVRNFKVENVILSCFVFFAFTGILVIFVGHLSAYLFASIIGFGSLSMLIIRVPTMNLILEQRKIDTGSASGLISFIGMLMGSIGMYLVILQPGTLIVSLGILNLAIGVVGALVWFSIRKRAFIRNVLERAA